MKTSWLIISILVLAVVSTPGQVSPPGASARAGQGTIQAQDTPYAVVEWGANHRIWQRTAYETLPSGQKVPRVHQYTELATGLNYQKNGQWVESKEEIELFSGGAIARQGQHQVIFANNLATVGAIDMQTPDGRRLRSHVLGLSYFDTASGQNVLIAEVKDSQGQLYPPNVVIYPDAFTDFKADVRYTYTRAGFEQDIILRERPPGPEAYGLNPATTELQVLTEFLNPPPPVRKQMTSKNRQGDALDEDLDFGTMRMGRGRAFSLERGGEDIPVSKQWLKLEGRDFLVEEVAMPDLEEELQALPAAEGAALNSAAGSVRHVVSKQRQLPAHPLVQAGTNKMQLAGLSLPAQGLVLDYVTFNSNQTNYTFQGDTTYYISGSYYSSGTNTFEGGTVIKFAANGSIAIVTGPGPTPIINWKAGAYRPVIFTAKDDNSVGESIGTGNPTGYYGNPMLTLGGNLPVVTLTGLRMSYANTAILFGGTRGNIYDAQFINCQNGLNLSGATVFVGNALFANVGTDFIFQGGSTLNAQNTTFSRSAFLATVPSYQTGSTLILTNCIMANVTNLLSGVLYGTNGNYNGFYNAPYVSNLGPVSFTNTFYPFQQVGAGNYYLTNGCSFLNAGTNNIDPTLLAALAKKTTHPPLWLTNTTVSVNTNLNPQAARDTQAAPDLGYHYDPIDYIADQWAITNATLTLTNGVAIATCNEAGVQLKDGSAITSIGSPVFPNWLVRYSSVQEQPVSLKGTNSSGVAVLPAYTSTMPSAQFRFTKFACPAGGGIHLYDFGASSCSNLLVQDCEFWSGANTLGGTNGAVLTLKNSLFARSVINASGNGSLSLSNTLAWGVSSVQLNPTSTNAWYAFNNDFDSCTITNSTLTNGYNAYLNCSGRFYPTNSHDVVLSSTLAYQTGPLGAFYQPTNSALIDKGNTNASLLGLYHYTTTTNEVKETNSLVDIGYHYVAVDTYGNPVDTNGNGIPDYYEDANGNGSDDSGEAPWDFAILSQPQSLTVPAGASATFTVTAVGIPSLSCQWRFNGANIAGATNSIYTVNPATPANAGNYSVIVSNYNLSASLTSSNATLTVTGPSINLSPLDLYCLVGAAPTVVDRLATVTNAPGCSSFSGRTLIVSLITNVQPEDALAINNQGASTNQIGVTNNGVTNFVTYWGTNIATFSGGGGSNALVISFLSTPTVTTPMVQALLTNITYRYYPSTNEFLGQRIVQFVLNDCYGNTNYPARKNINLNCPWSLDVMLVLDCSTSMNSFLGNTNSKISAAKAAAISFIMQDMQFTNDQVGLVTFSTTATNRSGLTNNPNQVINIINGLATINTTDIGDGIAYAQADFPTNVPAGTLPVMILLTDGLPNQPTDPTNYPNQPVNPTNYCIAKATLAKQAGIRLITIGLGTNGDFNPNLLTTLASSPSDFIWATNTDALTPIYHSIGCSLCRPPTNQPPTVYIIAPATNASFNFGAPITNTAVAYDWYGTVSNVQFYYSVNGGMTNLMPGTVAQNGTNYTLIWTNAPPGTNSLIAVATDNGGLARTSAPPVVVFVVPTTTVSISPSNQTACPGLTVYFNTVVTGAGPFGYVWKQNGNLLSGQTSNSLILTNVSSANAGTYTVEVTGACGSATNSAILMVLATTTAVGPTNLVCNVGQTAAFVTTAAGSGPFSYVWRKSGNLMSGQTTSTLTITNIALSDVGTYTVEVTGACGGSETNSATLTVNVPPIIIQQPVNVTTNVGGSATFSVTVSTNSTLPLSCQWYFNGTNRLGGATNTSLTLANVQSTNAGNYSVVVANVAGSVVSSNAVLTVNRSVPTVQITSPINQTLLARSNVIISATATNVAPGVTISWVEFFSSATNSLGFVAVPTNGLYQLNWMPPIGGTNVLTALAMNSQGQTAWSQPVTNYVRGLPLVSIASPANGQIFSAFPTNIVISATAVGDRATIANVVFYQGTNIVGTTNIASPFYTIAWTNVTSGTYTLHARATDSTGVGGISSNIVITIEPANRPPSVFVGPNQTNYLSTNAVPLIGFVSDDGLPVGGSFTVSWTNLNGGTNVTFASSNLPVTSAHFLATGTYVLRLSASDSQYTTTSNFTMTVLPANQPPYVYAGTNQTIILPALASTNPLQFITLVPAFTQITQATNEFAGGFDYYAPSNCFIVSVDPNICSFDFELIFTNGRSKPLSSISCITFGNKYHDQNITTVRSTLGGFKIGTMFTGNDAGGQIMRVEPDGTVIGTNVWWDFSKKMQSNAWLVLGNQNVGNVNGGLWVDRTGVWGGDLIAITAGSPAGVWRINSGGKATLITSLPYVIDDSGITTIPNDVGKYGPWAGRILVGGTDHTDSPIYAIDTNGLVATYNLGCGGETIRVIPNAENMFAWYDNHDGSLRMEMAAASEFQGMAGDVLIADENAWQGGGHLSRVHWNGNNFDVFPLVSDNQEWEGVNFIPTGLSNMPPIGVQLNGIVTDDGELFSPTSNAWNVVSGPGAVIIGDPTQTNTTAEFSVAGDYVLQLSAYDGQYTSSSNVTIHALRNQAPVVSAGTNQIITNTITTLHGNVSDDGLPRGVTNIVWTEASGPTQVAITTSNQAQTSINFYYPGTYVLMLTADDGQATNSAQVTISVKSPNLTLTPSYGSATRTSTNYSVTAQLVNTNGNPITNVTVNFTVNGANPTSAPIPITTDVNGNAVFSYWGVNNGRDSIQAYYLSNPTAYSPIVSKDWGRNISCGDVYLGQLDGLGGSRAREWPTNMSYYADYYVYNGFAGDSIELTLVQEYIGGLGPRPGLPMLLLLRDPSDQLAAVSPPSSQTGDRVSLNYVIPTSGDYVIEVVTLAAYCERYDLYLSCSDDTNGPQMNVLFNGTNIPSGGTIAFPPTSQGMATNITLVITNAGSMPFQIIGIGTNGDFTFNNFNNIWGSTTLQGASTNLSLTFNASSSGLSWGALALVPNYYAAGSNYIVYFMASTYPTSAPPAIQLIAPPDGSTFFDSQYIQFTAAVTPGSAYVITDTNYNPVVELERVTTNNITTMAPLYVDSNNNFTGTAWPGLLPDGDNTISASVTDINNQTGTAPPKVIHVLPFNSKVPTQSADMQVLYLGTNVPSGSTIVFPPTLPGAPTNILLVITNSGNYPLGITNSVGPNGDFTLTNSVLDSVTLPGGSTNLGITFNASTNGVSVGTLGLANNAGNGQYVVNFVGNAFPPGSGPPSNTNQPPVAVNDEFTVQANSVNNVLNPLANDYDTNGNPLTIIAVTSSDGGTATIINNGTRISYTPPPNIRSYTNNGVTYPADGFDYEISDGHGGTDWATVYMLIVASDMPLVSLTASSYNITAGNPDPLTASVTPSANIVKVDFYLGKTLIGEVMNGVNGLYTTNWLALYDNCNCAFLASATDKYGQVGVSQPIYINVIPPTNGTLVATLDSVADSNGTTPLTNTNLATIRDGLFTLYGRANHSLGSNVVWQLEVYTQDGTTLLRNLTPAVVGPVGTTSTPAILLTNCDLTTLINGVYDLRLTVSGGYQLATADVLFRLESSLKIGQFSFSQQDLIIPVNGIPLTVTRTYNSINPDKGDFGYGWTYALSDMDVTIDESREDIADLDGNVFSERSGGSWDVTLTMPNGQRTTFYFSLQLIGNGTYQAIWQAAPGVTATLITTDDNNLQTLVGGLNGNRDLFYWEAAGQETPMNVFDFSNFILTTQDGTKYMISREDMGEHFVLDDGGGYYVQAYGNSYLAQIIQRTSDTITINPNSVVYTNGNGAKRQIIIQRNSDGLITSISDPAAAVSSGPPAVKYEYDADQNLIDVQNLVERTGNGTYVTNFFAYNNVNFPHYITDIINANGTQVAKNFYDDSGKLIAVQDANGNLTRFIHSLTNDTEVVIDRLGHTNTYVYDTRGNVTAQTNALGQITTMAYDVLNNKTSEIIFTNGQPYATNSYAYKTNLNVLIASTDPLGHTNGFTYDGFGNVLTSADAKGNTATNFYDASTGNLLGTSDALGNKTTNFYSLGLFAGSRDAVGTVTTNYYDTTNNLKATATYVGATILSSNTFTYDANGNRLTSTVWRRTNGVWTGAITKFVYDAMNRVVQTIDPAGGTNTVVYDPAGKQQAAIDTLGRTNSYFYDLQGRLIQTTYPDLTTESSAYDPVGNRITSTDRAGRTTIYVYDALNRLTQTIYPDNTTNATVYDGVGRVAQTIDARGTITAFAYDAAGRRLAVTNAFGTSVAATNYYGYDANGSQITFTDALNHVTANFYDALNRQTNVTFADGTKQITVYDAAGRRVAGVDQAGITNGFVYDGLGRLVSVTNALGQVTRYQYDEAGNETAQIDALNRTNTFAYDGMGRRVSHTRPDAKVEYFYYDLAGNLTNHQDFKPNAVYSQYDTMNRPTNSADTIYTYTATGQRQTMTYDSGTTVYNYDNRDRLVQKIVTWWDGMTASLNYRYDANGNLTNMLSGMANGVNLAYSYDPLNRLTNVLSHGQLAASYCYDAVGNLQGMRYGNGVTNLYQYDSLNRLTNLTWKLNGNPVAGFVYQLKAGGTRTNLVETINTQPSALNYTYAWQYDNLYRLTNETIGGASYTSPQSLGYGYDPVGNRTFRTNITGSLNLANQSFTFNTNDWLSTDQYDNNGNTTSANDYNADYYAYDELNRLITWDTNNHYTYDGDGNRVGKLVGYLGYSFTKYYLVDDRNPSGYPQVVEEYQVYGVTMLNRVYNYGLGLISQQQIDTNTLFPGVLSYYGYDGHGSVRFLTDKNGSITDSYTYDAYGNLIGQTGSTPNNYLYACQQWDSDLGLYYNRARYLNPNTGRFWTMDTYAGNNEDPLSLHKYLYCQANPINMVDPDGLKAYLYLLGEDSAGLQFKKSADYLSSQLSLTAGDKVVIEDIHGFDDFNKALKDNTDIAELNYIGHGGPGILFIGEGRDPDTNITEKGGRHVIGNSEFQSKSVNDLYVYNVRRDASIHLYSCYSGRAGWDYNAIDLSFSEHFGVPAYGGWFGTKFKPNGKPYTFGGYDRISVSEIGASIPEGF